MPSLNRPGTTETLLPPALEQPAARALGQLAEYPCIRHHITGVVLSGLELTIPGQMSEGHHDVIVACRPRSTDPNEGSWLWRVHFADGSAARRRPIRNPEPVAVLNFPEWPTDTVAKVLQARKAWM